MKMSDGELVYHQLVITCVLMYNFYFVFDSLKIVFSCVCPEICGTWESNILVYI